MTTRRVNGEKRRPQARHAADSDRVSLTSSRARRINGEKRRPPARRTADRTTPQIRPTTKRTLRGLGGRRLVLEGFGPRAPTHLAIVAGGAPPIGAWISPRELRSFIEAARKILR